MPWAAVLAGAMDLISAACSVQKPSLYIRAGDRGLPCESQSKTVPEVPLTEIALTLLGSIWLSKSLSTFSVVIHQRLASCVIALRCLTGAASDNLLVCNMSLLSFIAQARIPEVPMSIPMKMDLVFIMNDIMREYWGDYQGAG